jgi:hypothetical protein
VLCIILESLKEFRKIPFTYKSSVHKLYFKPSKKMKKMLLKFADNLLSKEQMKNVKGGQGVNCRIEIQGLGYSTVSCSNIYSSGACETYGCGHGCRVVNCWNT